LYLIITQHFKKLSTECNFNLDVKTKKDFMIESCNKGKQPIILKMTIYMTYPPLTKVVKKKLLAV